MGAVKKVMLHEEYDSWTINNDICLLELESNADFGSSAIGAIGLPADGEEYSAGTICTVSGWGTTSEGGSLAQVLMKVDVPVGAMMTAVDPMDSLTSLTP